MNFFGINRNQAVGIVAMASVLQFSYTITNTVNLQHVSTEKKAENAFFQSLNFLLAGFFCMLIRPQDSLNRACAAMGVSLLGLYSEENFGSRIPLDSFIKSLLAKVITPSLKQFLGTVIPLAVVAHGFPFIASAANGFSRMIGQKVM